MSRYHSYLNSATSILASYKGEEPFASFIKKYFAAHKKFGSTDRRTVSHLCYCFFRLGKALPGIPIEERILTGLFLCSDTANKILDGLKPEWNRQTGLSLAEKLTYIHQTDLVSTIFPWQHELSDGIENEAFTLSHLQQPDLFLRLRPGKENSVRQKLTAAGISYTILTDSCLALPNTSKIDNLLELDKEAVVQDYNSQRTGEFLQFVSPESFEQVRRGPSDLLRVWDCCAASGGKSIMAMDLLGDIDLIVSDVRESILINLEDRFRNAGIHNYESFVADLGKPLPISLSSFNLVIADVPCTGSGTWSRSPEQLVYFDATVIDRYVALQKKIITNVIPQLEPGGYLLYITCSVFKKENEEAVDFIASTFHLELIKKELLKGYDKKADTLFAALLQKP
jgi:16S rRNA (cytosine967-C5)-methyltransferase